MPLQHSTISLTRQIVLSALALLLFTSSALAEKRIALVVGNSNYQNVPRLNNPTNDARLWQRWTQSLYSRARPHNPQAGTWHFRCAK
jgi:hypothetical protein